MCYITTSFQNIFICNNCNIEFNLLTLKMASCIVSISSESLNKPNISSLKQPSETCGILTKEKQGSTYNRNE